MGLRVRKKLLWVGDAAVPSGFAKATHGVLQSLDYRISPSNPFDVNVLGMNYRGDPHDYPYPIWSAAPGGDPFGVGRFSWMVGAIKPDVIVIQQDPWNFPFYFDQLKKVEEHANIPVIGVVAVDSGNCLGTALNELQGAIFWTEFGLNEARKGGFTQPGTVIPLGVDRSVYRTDTRARAREKFLPEYLGEGKERVSRDDVFIVGCVGRNQLRKRLDLTLSYFAEWIRQYDIRDAWLYIHSAPTGERGFDLAQLASHYDVLDRLILVTPEMFYGLSEEDMSNTYNCFDLYWSTSQGEGMGLPALEAMACGIPCVLPESSAFVEWAREAAYLVYCNEIAVTPGGPNSIGTVVDRTSSIQALDRLYKSSALRKGMAQESLNRAAELRFNWEHIGQRFREEVLSLSEIKCLAAVV